MTNPKSGVAESVGLACSRAAAGENRMKDSENKGKGADGRGAADRRLGEMSQRECV